MPSTTVAVKPPLALNVWVAGVGGVLVFRNGKILTLPENEEVILPYWSAMETFGCCATNCEVMQVPDGCWLNFNFATTSELTATELETAPAIPSAVAVIVVACA